MALTTWWLEATSGHSTYRRGERIVLGTCREVELRVLDQRLMVFCLRGHPDCPRVVDVFRRNLVTVAKIAKALVDEYHVLVHPVILGAGKPLFKDIKERHNLKLLEAKTFKNGVVLLRYQLMR